MNKKQILLTVLISLALVFSACSSEEETLETQEDIVLAQEETLRENASTSQEEQMIENVTSLDDGEYLIDLSYEDPAGTNQAQLSLSISEGVISSVAIEIIEGSDIAFKKAEEFNEAATQELVGMSLENIDSNMIIGGASLTTEAVMNSIQNYEGN